MSPWWSCFRRGGCLETCACLHSPRLFFSPHTIVQHKVPIASLSLVVGRQTGWTRGDQETGSLSLRRAMSSEMRLLKSS